MKRRVPPPAHYNPPPMFGLRVKRFDWAGVLASIGILDGAKLEEFLIGPFFGPKTTEPSAFQGGVTL